MISENRLYRRALKPVGSPLPANAADLASTLVVEWHDMTSGGNEAFVEGHTLEVGATGWAVYRGRRGATVANGSHSMPKRAAVLALTQHLVDVRDRKPEASTVASFPQAMKPTHPIEACQGTCAGHAPTSKPIEARAFKVGDRVRCLAGGPGRTGAFGTVATQLSNGAMVTIDGQNCRVGFTRDELEHVPAEKPAVPAKAPIREVDVTGGPRTIALYVGDDVRIRNGEHSLTLTVSRSGRYRLAGRPGCGVIDVTSL